MSKVWVTREGDEIPISQLEDSHIVNIIRYFNKYLDKIIEIPFEINGETKTLIQTYQMPDKLEPIYEEADRRNLLEQASWEIPKDGRLVWGWYEDQWIKVRYLDDQTNCEMMDDTDLPLTGWYCMDSHNFVGEPERWKYIDENLHV